MNTLNYQDGPHHVMVLFKQHSLKSSITSPPVHVILLMAKYFHNCQAALRGETGENKPQEKPGKGSAKRTSTKQKRPTRTQPSTVNTGSKWSVKQIVGGLLGILCLIIVCAAVVQRTTKHAGVTGHIFVTYLI